MDEPFDPASHLFGGAWTELKLRAISDYLAFFTKALQHPTIPKYTVSKMVH